MILDDEDKLEDAFIFHLPVKRQRSGMPTNVLVVGPKVAKPEDLNVLEEGLSTKRPRLRGRIRR